jgi:hypothetical protein
MKARKHVHERTVEKRLVGNVGLGLRCEGIAITSNWSCVGTGKLQDKAGDGNGNGALPKVSRGLGECCALVNTACQVWRSNRRMNPKSVTLCVWTLRS